MKVMIKRTARCSDVVDSYVEKYTGRVIIRTADGSRWVPFDRPVYSDRAIFGVEKDGKICETNERGEHQ